MLDNPLYLKRNVGPVDRVIRLIVGAALVVMPLLFLRSPWAIAILAAFGGAQILEGIIAYWVVLDILGWSTLNRAANRLWWKTIFERRDAGRKLQIKAALAAGDIVRVRVFTGQGIEVKVGVIMAVNNPRGEFKVLFTVAKILNKSSQKQGEG